MSHRQIRIPLINELIQSWTKVEWSADLLLLNLLRCSEVHNSPDAQDRHAFRTSGAPDATRIACSDLYQYGLQRKSICTVAVHGYDSECTFGGRGFHETD